MFRRAVVSGLAGLTIAVLLFLIMHVLIARSQRARSYPDAYPIVDFVRLPPEAEPPPRDEREPPRNPIRPKYRQPRALPYRRRTSLNFRHRKLR